MNNENRVRVLKTPRVRRRPKTAKDKAPEIDLPAPLSQLTENLHHVPIKDMEAWVNRPADVRRREAEKKGKIARPMNSFMMYRSAYADRVKEWCAQNNHQFVSQISGLSWPREPPAVREKYELLALVERDNHQKAHPEYKFAPNKTQTPPRKKRSNGNGLGWLWRRLTILSLVLALVIGSILLFPFGQWLLQDVLDKTMESSNIRPTKITASSEIAGQIGRAHV